MVYCIRCGRAIQDKGAAFCPACGAPVSAQPPQGYQPPPQGYQQPQQGYQPQGYQQQGYQQPYQQQPYYGAPVQQTTGTAVKKKSKTVPVLIVLFLAVALAVVLGLFVVPQVTSGYSSMKEAVYAYGNAVHSGNFKKALHQLPDKYITYLLDEAHLNEEQYVKAHFSSGDIRDECTVIGIYERDPFSTSDIASLNARLEEAGIHSKVEEAYRVRYSIRYRTRSGDIKETNGSEFCRAFKLNGRWYAYH